MHIQWSIIQVLFKAILVNLEDTVLSGINHREGWYYTISLKCEIYTHKKEQKQHTHRYREHICGC